MVKPGLLRLGCVAAGSICLTFLGPSDGQSQAARESPHLTFDVASVRRTAKDMGAFMRGGPGSGDPGRIMYHSMPWEALLRRAFGVRNDQLECLGWMTSGDYFYDVNATMPPTTTEEEFRLMLQRLLVDRFHLVYHRSRKRFPGYELTVAPGGPKFRPYEPTTGDLDETAQGRAATAAEGFPVIPTGRTFAFKLPRMLNTAGVIRGTFRQSMSKFLEQVPIMIMNSNRESGWPRYRVVDRTGLEGLYAFTLEYVGGTALDAPDAPGGPSIFQALEQQLGLKLNKVKDVEEELIVVDGADRLPSEN
jgi:uncharacterized protein (TIGR03435 family)